MQRHVRINNRNFQFVFKYLGIGHSLRVAKEMNQISILLICVNYHTEKPLKRFLQSIRVLDRANCDLRVTIVDNGSTEGGFDFLNQGDFDGLRVNVVMSPDNLGYFGGASYGLQSSIDETFSPEWTIVGNCDLEILDSKLFSVLRNYVQDPNLGLVAPSIISTTSGKDSNPFFVDPPALNRFKLWRLIFSNYYTAIFWELCSTVKIGLWQMLSRFKPDSQPLEKTIYAPHGSCFIFNRNYFQRGGTFNYECFLFGEEFFVAEEARRLGLNVRYDPQIRIVHHEHSITGEIASRQKIKYIREAQQYWYDYFVRQIKTDSKPEIASS